MCSTPQVVFEGFVTRSLYTRFLLKVVSRDAKGEGIVVETDKAPLSDRLLEKWFRATPRAKALSLSPIRRLCLIVSLVADAGVREHPDKHPQDTKPRRRSRDWTCRENAKSGFGVLYRANLHSAAQVHHWKFTHRAAWPASFSGAPVAGAALAALAESIRQCRMRHARRPSI